MECSRGKGHFCHQHQCLVSGDHPCHRKWGSIFALNPNVVNPKIQHHRPFVLPPKVSRKLTELHLLIHLCHWQRSLPLFPPFSNTHIALRHKTQHLRNLHVKMCKHCSHHYFSVIIFLDSAINIKFSSLQNFLRFAYFSLISLPGRTNREIQLTSIDGNYPFSIITK